MKGVTGGTGPVGPQGPRGFGPRYYVKNSFFVMTDLDVQYSISCNSGDAALSGGFDFLDNDTDMFLDWDRPSGVSTWEFRVRKSSSASRQVALYIKCREDA